MFSDLFTGSLQRVISHYPKVMVLPIKRVNMVSRLLKEKCQVTVQQLTDILRDSPEVLEEDLARLEYKFQVWQDMLQVWPAEHGTSMMPHQCQPLVMLCWLFYL